jgi:hypothetical protein
VSPHRGWKLSDPAAAPYFELCLELGIRNIHVHKGPTIWPLDRDAFDVADVDHAAGPFDVVVRIGAAGLCRTDLHIQEGQWAAKSQVKLPYTPGHENAGWVHEIGSGVTNVGVGDTVIVHPFISCGLCRPCRKGDDMHCLSGGFPGINRDGGFAEFLLTSARSVVRLDPSLEPASIAALADAGLTAIHAVKKAIPILGAGTKAVVIGAGGLGHIGIQCLKAYTPCEITVVDPSEKALALAGELGADHTVKVDGSQRDVVAGRWSSASFMTPLRVSRRVRGPPRVTTAWSSRRWITELVASSLPARGGPSWLFGWAGLASAGRRPARAKSSCRS